MDDSLVRRRPRRPEAGKLGVDAVALQDVDGRYWLAALLVGYRTLYDRPRDAPGSAVFGLFGDILETAVDHRFEGIEPLLRSLLRDVSPCPFPSIRGAWRSLAPRTSIPRVPVAAFWPRCRPTFLAGAVVAGSPSSRSPVGRGSVARRLGGCAADRLVCTGCRRVRGAREPRSAPSAVRWFARLAPARLAPARLATYGRRALPPGQSSARLAYRARRARWSAAAVRGAAVLAQRAAARLAILRRRVLRRIALRGGTGGLNEARPSFWCALHSRGFSTRRLGGARDALRPAAAASAPARLTVARQIAVMGGIPGDCGLRGLALTLCRRPGCVG